ncbi:hypothetical protein V6119_22720, partial [Klebsiella pneumoniae]
KRAYCLKTQPATGETYPKSDLFNKAHKVINGAIPFPNFRSSLKSDLHPSQIAHVVSKRK